MLVSYYLPGNSLAAPPSHRVGGATANVEGQHGFLIPSHLSGGWEGQHSTAQMVQVLPHTKINAFKLLSHRS